MEASEPIKANRSFTNKLGSKTIRLGFYGMYRKLPSDSTDSILGSSLTLASGCMGCSVTRQFRVSLVQAPN